ncbi:hypothetical protein [uncultured Sphingomonas sp.]|uniref:hypothetical protein n=1 Tax=uncultured Sphingomonas sp. TaxID=158754 RepID=UPI0025DB0CEC|nr:hypothetical protein [uncultured Sphingomonas sp.]
MNGLTMKQRAKVNAALCMIHYQGHSVDAVQARVRAHAASGMDLRAAYETGLNEFITVNPAMQSPLGRVTGLIEASDEATVARYDAAINRYIETGDETAVNELEPMMREDALALAVRNGELDASQAASGQVDWGAESMAAPASAPPLPVAPAEPSQRFAWATGSAPAQPATGENSGPIRIATAEPKSVPFTPNALPGSDTAVRIGRGWEKMNASVLPTWSKPSPYEGMSPGQIKDAMASAYAVKPGWQQGESES